jgi:endonuclease/exonuclease/phosphatase family metal-dependent hydrolase
MATHGKDQDSHCSATETQVANSQLKIATFNLFNYLEPPNAYYEFERIYTAEQWAKKQRWIIDYLQQHQPDVIGFQEVFSIESLQQLLQAQGYAYFAVVDKPEVIDEFIYKRPVVAIAARYPIVAAQAVEHDRELAKTMGLTSDFTFSRQVLRATVQLPHIGDTDCYVVHFKSKRPTIEVEQQSQALSAEENIIATLTAEVAGGWGASIQRGSEAALLMVAMIKRRAASQLPMLLMGDFNNPISDGVLSHLLTDSLRNTSSYGSKLYLSKYCLNDAWELFSASQLTRMDDPNEGEEQPLEKAVQPTRKATHYYGASSSVLDYILLSCEFDPRYDDSFFAVTDYQTYDRHLINPQFARDDLSTDHGVVLITLTLRT